MDNMDAVHENVKSSERFNPDEIMEEIRAEFQEKDIREVTDPFTGIPLTKNVTPEMIHFFVESQALSGRVKQLNKAYALNCEQKAEGGLKGLIRRIIWAMGKVIVMPLVEQQNQVNAEITRCVNSVFAQIEYQKSYIEILEKEICQMQEQLKDKGKT